MEKKYFVRYMIDTPNSIEKRQGVEGRVHSAWKFNLGKSEFALIDYDFGLYSDFYLKAYSIMKAEQKSKAIIETILNFIDYSTVSASAPAFLAIIYDATENQSRREFKQIIYKTLLDRNITVIDKDIFGEIFQAFNKNKDSRIVRAVSWLRKAFLEEKPIDKFIAFWTGLECINVLLCDNFEIPPDERKWKCSKCDTTILPISSKGIKALFIDELKIKKKRFEKIRDARNNLLHGRIPLDDDFVSEIREYNPLVKNVLITGLGKLLKLKNETIEKILKEKTFRYNEKVRFVIITELLDFNPPILKDFGKQPWFEITKDELLERFTTEERDLTIKGRLGLKLVNARCNKDIVVEVRGEDESSIKKVDLY